MIKYRALLIILSLYILNGCVEKSQSQILSKKSEKINGISFVSSNNPIIQEQVDPILAVQANSAAVMPFGFIKELEHPQIRYNTSRQWYGETFDGIKQYIQFLHKNNIEVMLKPQIWISHGEYTGHLKMTSEENWKELEVSYTKFILDYARVAEENKVAIFCIGTELEQFVINRQGYWIHLISEIKKIYNGKLTYAANWDEYKRIPFWTSLDYIGVDAYFPVSEAKTPTVEEISQGWQRWKDELRIFSEAKNQKIVFTEYGYRSVDYTGKEPWKSDRDMKEVNLEAQANALTGLYQVIWNEPWFKGGYLWKWFGDHKQSGGQENHMFTPQNKIAETIISTYYKNSN